MPRLLIVDQNPATAARMRVHFPAAQFTIHTETSLSAAREHIAREAPDLVLVSPELAKEQPTDGLPQSAEPAVVFLPGPGWSTNHAPSNGHAQVAAAMVPGEEGEGSDAATELQEFVTAKLRTGSDDLYAETQALMERVLITQTLQHTRGNQSQAARILGITRGSLRNKIRLLRIPVESFGGA